LNLRGQQNTSPLKNPLVLSHFKDAKTSILKWNEYIPLLLEGTGF
jgi:hypothetical protein